MPSSQPSARTVRTARRLTAGALAAAAGLVPLAGPATARAADGLCVSRGNPALAARLSADLAAALSGRAGTIAFTVWDPRTGVSCARNAGVHFDAASVVKVTIMGAVFRRAMDEQRGLTGWEKDNLYPMITRSDNDAASRLWRYVGRDRLASFLRLARMSHTGLGPDGRWGLTQITAADELRLLDVFTTASPVLSADFRAYGLELMNQVVPWQRWGTPAGAPPGVTVHVKNGWLPRSTHGWRVHSIGVFTGRDRDYRMAVLTQDNATMGAGVTTIERIARVVHRDLG